MNGKTRFEELGIEKQEQAYKEGYAKKQFFISCYKCCYENKRPCGTCGNCPIKKAHIEALTEIAQGKRVSPVIIDNRQGAKKSYTKTKSGQVIVTIVINT